MDHNDFELLLPDAAAGMPDGSTGELLKAHLEHCAACRERLEGFRRILADVHSATQAMRVPDGYFAGIIPRFRERLSNRDSSFLNMRWFQLVSPVAAALVVVGLFSTLQISPRPADPIELRALVAELEAAEVTDAFLSEIDQQPFASMSVSDAVGGAITREAVSRQLLERIAELSDQAPLQSVDDLESKELDVLLQRLQSRKYL
jgi:hypothetical protein